jgi:iron complex transport system ATP-binding protein
VNTRDRSPIALSRVTLPVSFGDMSERAVLSLTDVSVRRDGITILGPLNFQVREGERWTILGPNGAGKSTLLQLLAAMSFPSHGTVEILGHVMGQVDVFEVRPRVGFCSSVMAEHIPEDELVQDVVLTAAYAVLGRWKEKYDLWDESRAIAILTTFGVRDLKDRVFGSLSEGERKRVQIARALMADPEILLLDEPAAGLDLWGREDLLRRFATFSQDPKAPVSILVTHHIEEIPEGTTHALLLQHGHIAVSGPIDQVITTEHVSAIFGLPISVVKEGARYFARPQ